MPNHSTITNQVPPKTQTHSKPRIPLPSTTTEIKSRKSATTPNYSHQLTSQASAKKNYPVFPRVPVSKGSSTKKKKGSPKAALNVLGTGYWVLGTSDYRPAAAAAGIIPAIAIPSIRASTLSTLAPVSVQPST